MYESGMPAGYNPSCAYINRLLTFHGHETCCVVQSSLMYVCVCVLRWLPQSTNGTFSANQYVMIIKIAHLGAMSHALLALCG